MNYYVVIYWCACFTNFSINARANTLFGLANFENTHAEVWFSEHFFIRKSLRNTSNLFNLFNVLSPIISLYTIFICFYEKSSWSYVVYKKTALKIFAIFEGKLLPWLPLSVKLQALLHKKTKSYYLVNNLCFWTEYKNIKQRGIFRILSNVFDEAFLLK